MGEGFMPELGVLDPHPAAPTAHTATAITAHTTISMDDALTTDVGVRASDMGVNRPRRRDTAVMPAVRRP